VQAPVEIRYAGVLVGRAQTIRRADDGSGRIFLATPDPLPVGTVIELVSEDSTIPGRVVKVTESADAAASGMDVRLIGAEALSGDDPSEHAAVAEVVAPEATGGIPEPIGVGDSMANGTMEYSTGVDASGGVDGAGDTNGAGKRKRKRKR
jgi:hypothetical protein